MNNAKVQLLTDYEARMYGEFEYWAANDGVDHSAAKLTSEQEACIAELATALAKDKTQIFVMRDAAGCLVAEFSLSNSLRILCPLAIAPDGRVGEFGYGEPPTYFPTLQALLAAKA